MNGEFDYQSFFDKTKKLLLAEVQGRRYAGSELDKLRKLARDKNSDFYDKALEQFEVINNYNADLTTINIVLDSPELEKLAKSILGYDDPFESFTREQIMKLFFHLPENISLAEIEGDSMIDAGLDNGDSIIYTRTKEIINGDMIVAIVDGYRYVKYYKQIDKSIYLISANKNYSDFKIGITNNFVVLGKVIQILKNVKPKNNL